MKLAELRNRRNLSQKDAAHQIGISTSMLAMMETGERSGTDKTKKKVADFYGVTVGYLFFGDSITKREDEEAIK